MASPHSCFITRSTIGLLYLVPWSIVSVPSRYYPAPSSMAINWQKNHRVCKLNSCFEPVFQMDFNRKRFGDQLVETRLNKYPDCQWYASGRTACCKTWSLSRFGQRLNRQVMTNEDHLSSWNLQFNLQWKGETYVFVNGNAFLHFSLFVSGNVDSMKRTQLM